jgi:hypothetical protein
MTPNVYDTGSRYHLYYRVKVTTMKNPLAYQADELIATTKKPWPHG